MPSEAFTTIDTNASAAAVGIIKVCQARDARDSATVLARRRARQLTAQLALVGWIGPAAALSVLIKFREQLHGNVRII